MGKPVYLSLSKLVVSKLVTYEIWKNHVEPKYGEKAKFCYIDTDNFLVCITTKHIYKRSWKKMFKQDLIKL